MSKSHPNAYLMVFLGVVVACTFVFTQKPAYSANHALVDKRAPEFTHHGVEQWVNSKPILLSELRGRVVLVDFWTFGCWNCYRSFDWLNEFQATFADKPFSIIGVHTPEFEHEKKRERIVEKIAEFRLKHPVMIDNDFSYWRAMGNQYWPAFYIIDKQGVVRGFYAGETHSGDSQARRIGNLVSRLLKEKDAPGTSQVLAPQN